LNPDIRPVSAFYAISRTGLHLVGLKKSANLTASTRSIVAEQQ
jgi:hypothetical protein